MRSQIVDPAWPRSGYVHNGVPIAIPPEDVLAMGSSVQQPAFLVLFFDAKRTWYGNLNFLFCIIFAGQASSVSDVYLTLSVGNGCPGINWNLWEWIRTATRLN